ncbi:dipeptidylpeptidase [Coemansia sp. RSA 2399]|nr:dipeptidylpeptidase [Coemansia sp. RSA 2399]
MNLCVFLSRNIWLFAIGAALALASAPADAPKPLDIRLFHSLRRLSPPVVSPDQTRALYTISYYEPDTNKHASYLALLDIATARSTQLTPAVDGMHVSNPLWLSESKAGYLSKGALYQHDLAPLTKGALVFNASTGIDSALYRRASKKLFFTADVYPDGQLDKVEQRARVEKERTDSGMVFDNLWARHWNSWMTPLKSNLFAIEFDPESSVQKGIHTGGSAVNVMRNLTEFKDPLLRWDIERYTVSEDGKYTAFVVRKPTLTMAWSTDVDLYLVPSDASADPILLTSAVKGIAGSPAFSVDGSSLAWLQMETPGYESDIRRIYILNMATGTISSVARDWTLSPHSVVWSSDGKRLFALASDRGDNKVFSIDVETGLRSEVTGYGYVASIARLGDDKLIAVYSNTTESGNIRVVDIADAKAPMRRLTDVNIDKLQNVYLGQAEDFWFSGALNESVHGWLVRPFNFDPSRKYPLALLIHGGPQQGNAHVFSQGQWNPNMYASAGFVAVQINFHGSSGYGQNFTDSITEQWGGYPYEDLMKGVDHVLATYGFVDAARMVALGASYGGYMVNWLNGNTNRFSAFVSHDGQFNVVSGYYATDELWFVEHDVGGVPFTKHGREKYEKYNPERLAAQFKTPTLFVHGANDFRLTIEQSIAPWTLLRRKGVPSRFLYFDDEDHWVSKPGNSMRWYSEVLKWITQWTTPSNSTANAL